MTKPFSAIEFRYFPKLTPHQRMRDTIQHFTNISTLTCSTINAASLVKLVKMFNLTTLILIEVHIESDMNLTDEIDADENSFENSES